MRMKRRRKYAPPALKESLVVPLEPALLEDSATVYKMFTIQGQSVDGYYEDEDLDAGWDWD